MELRPTATPPPSEGIPDLGVPGDGTAAAGETAEPGLAEGHDAEAPGNAVEENGASRRRRILAHVLERIGPEAFEEGDAHSAGRLNLDGRRLELENWQRATLRKRWEEGAAAGRQVWSDHLLEGLAYELQAGRLLDRWKLAPLAEADADRLHQEAVDCAAAGLALQEELQRDIDRLALAGQVAELKRLTLFQHTIGRSVLCLGEQLGEPAFGAAAKLARDLVGPRREAAAVSARARRPVEVEERRTHVRFERAHRPARPVEVRPRRRRPTRLAPLLAVLTLSLVVFGIQRLTATRSVTPPVLPFEQFAGMPGVEDVVARPPSLFVVIDADVWEDLPPAGQLEQVERIGAIAGDAGYTGAHLRTSAGRPLGQWLAHTGSRVFDPAAGT